MARNLQLWQQCLVLEVMAKSYGAHYRLKAHVPDTATRRMRSYAPTTRSNRQGAIYSRRWRRRAIQHVVCGMGARYALGEETAGVGGLSGC